MLSAMRYILVLPIKRFRLSSTHVLQKRKEQWGELQKIKMLMGMGSAERACLLIVRLAWCGYK